MSSAHKQTGLVAEEDLFFSEGQRQTWGPWQRAIFGEFEGIAYEYTEGKVTWRRWFLRWGQILLFVTYNGTAEAAERERTAVEQLLSTVRPEVGGEVYPFHRADIQ